MLEAQSSQPVQIHWLSVFPQTHETSRVLYDFARRLSLHALPAIAFLSLFPNPTTIPTKSRYSFNLVNRKQITAVGVKASSGI